MTDKDMYIDPPMIPLRFVGKLYVAPYPIKSCQKIGLCVRTNQGGAAILLFGEEGKDEARFKKLASDLNEWANPHLAVSLDRERALLVNRKKRYLFKFLASSNNFEYLQSVVCRAAMKMGKEQKRDPNCVCSEFERLIEICCQQFGIDLDNPKEII